MIIILLLCAILLLVFSGFLSGAETAFFTLSTADKEALNSIMPKKGFEVINEPNIIYHVYKIRKGKWNKIKVWIYFDHATCRTHDCFVTDNDNKLLPEIKETQIETQIKTQRKTQEKAEDQFYREPLIIQETYKPPDFIPDFAKADDVTVNRTFAAETAASYDADIIKSQIPDLTYIYVPSPSTGSTEKNGIGDYRIAGQFFGTYWLIERLDGESCYLMDQHAAHERVIFEELSAGFAEKGAVSQRMVEPVAVKLTPGEKQTITNNMQLLINMGFELEDMYDDNIAIRAVPYIFDSPADGGFFMEIVDKLCDEQEINSPYEARLEAVSRMACRAAVKANDRLSDKEAKALVERVLESDNPFTCPHGRPVMVELTRRAEN